MKWILIIILNTGNGAAISSVEYSTLEKCQSALKEISAIHLTNYGYLGGTAPIAMCTEK